MLDASTSIHEHILGISCMSERHKKVLHALVLYGPAATHQLRLAGVLLRLKWHPGKKAALEP